MTNPIGINNLSQSSNIANATGDEVVSLDKHINTSATDTDQIQAFQVVSTWMAPFKMICIQKINHLTYFIKIENRQTIDQEPQRDTFIIVFSSPFIQSYT